MARSDGTLLGSTLKRDYQRVLIRRGERIGVAFDRNDPDAPQRHWLDANSRYRLSAKDAFTTPHGAIIVEELD